MSTRGGPGDGHVRKAHSRKLLSVPVLTVAEAVEITVVSQLRLSAKAKLGVNHSE